MLTVVLQIIFYTGAGIILYTYFGYALLLAIFPKRKRRSDEALLPPVTIVVPVFNEEKIIEKKIRQLLRLSYPAGLLKILVVDDGSTDQTFDIIRKYENIEWLRQQKRKGKTAALNLAMQQVTTPVVVFTDANALPEKSCLLKIVRHYADEGVGGVSGEKKIATVSRDGAVGPAEQIYWQYESLLKKTDSGFYSVVGADGGLFSIRTHLFQPIAEDVILDDFFISVSVCRQGYDFVYEPQAYALESSSTSMEEEQKRKVRISAGCFQALVRLPELLNPFRNFRLFLVYLSHRVLRWVACPLLLPVIYYANLMLVLLTPSPFFGFTFLLQSLFYLLALLGWLQVKSKADRTPFLLPYYFVFMNVSLYLGFFRHLAKRQSVMWEKTERSPV